MKKFAFEFNKYRRFVFLIADVCCMIASCAFVWIFFELISSFDNDITIEAVVTHTIVYVVTAVLMLAVAGAYKPVWRYATMRDLVSCFVGVVISSFFSYIFMIVLTYVNIFPLRFSLIYSVVNMMLSLLLILSMRILYKTLRDYTRTMEEKASDVHKSRTMIVGAGATCRVLLTEMQVGDSLYYPVLAVDDDPAKIGRKIKDIRIEGPICRVPEICEKENIETIIVAIPSCTEDERRTILEYCSKTTCKIRVLPYLHNLVAGEMLTQAKPLQLEELLCRAPIAFNQREITAFVQDKVCLVTGGGGL